MSEQVDLQILLREIRAMRKELATLTTVIAKDKIYDAWIDESTAAQMLNLSSRTLRTQCKSNKLPIHYRNTNGRHFQYSRKDLKEFLKQTSTSL